MRVPGALLVQVGKSPAVRQTPLHCPLTAGIGLLLLFLSLSSANAQQSPLEWKPLHAPEVPGPGAVSGGPGRSSSQAAPVYLCRAKSGSSLYPGKWIDGSCKIAVDGREVVASEYEVAYGPAEWRDYQPGDSGLLPIGDAGDGSTLYSCRVQYRGYQLGVMVDSKCEFPFDGRTIVQRPPFEALYEPGNAPPPAPAQTIVVLPPKNQKRSDDNLGSLAPATGENPNTPSLSCRKEIGNAAAKQLVKQCLQVSPATHPPCNADNACSLIRNQIRRGCRLLGTRAPDFCEPYR